MTTSYSCRVPRPPRPPRATTALPPLPPPPPSTSRYSTRGAGDGSLAVTGDNERRPRLSASALPAASIRISPVGSTVESGGGGCGSGGGNGCDGCGCCGCGAACCGGLFGGLGGVTSAEPSGGGGSGGGAASGADTTGRKVVTPTRWSLEVARVTPGSLCCSVPATARVRGCSRLWQRLQPYVAEAATLCITWRACAACVLRRAVGLTELVAVLLGRLQLSPANSALGLPIAQVVSHLV